MQILLRFSARPIVALPRAPRTRVRRCPPKERHFLYPQTVLAYEARSRGVVVEILFLFRQSLIVFLKKNNFDTHF